MVIRFAHPSGRTELRALLRYAPFLQGVVKSCEGSLPAQLSTMLSALPVFASIALRAHHRAPFLPGYGPKGRTGIDCAGWLSSTAVLCP